MSVLLWSCQPPLDSDSEHLSQQEKSEAKPIIIDHNTEAESIRCWLLTWYGEECWTATASNRLRLIIAGGIVAPTEILSLTMLAEYDRYSFKKSDSANAKYFHTVTTMKNLDATWPKLSKLLRQHHFFELKKEIHKKANVISLHHNIFWSLEILEEGIHHYVIRELSSQDDRALLLAISDLLEHKTYAGLPLDTLLDDPLYR